jgi:hypothetical protein
MSALLFFAGTIWGVATIFSIVGGEFDWHLAVLSLSSFGWAMSEREAQKCVNCK